MWRWQKPKRIWGYYDLGPVVIPPRPPKPALTDRVSGSVYALTKDGSNPSVSVLADTAGYKVFPAHAEPTIRVGDTRLRRLFVSSGALSSEEVTNAAYHGRVLITVSASPLDVWEVVWDNATDSLTLEEVL